VSRVGVRSEWRTVPSSIRVAVEKLVGSSIAAVTQVEGGFSPGPAVRADTLDGRAVFIKAAGLALNPISPSMHRREAEVLQLLPDSVPAPALLGVVDDDDWIAVVTEWIDGRHPDASSPPDVHRLLALVHAIASHDAPEGLHPFADAHPSLLGNWGKLAANPPVDLDPWSRQHLDRLATLEDAAPAAAAGPFLVHADIRTDNTLLAAKGQRGDVIVDWPAACHGAAWVDLVGLLPALHLDGGPPPDAVFGGHPLARGVDAAAVDAVVAAIAGYFTRHALQLPPPGLPTVRAFQAAQGVIARRWLAERLRLKLRSP
jgi:aminoglycoside phosphotransferase (APT) family kinase protein